ncbi:hypothetical protein ACHMW5_30050 [Azospirillum melinis]|uniref:hypothetical protein n=1 Tax=Azospirillum melinis TaxID=328839 RepID=UPI003756BEBE
MKPALEETQSNREDFLGHRVCLVLDGRGGPAEFGFGQVFRNCEIAPQKSGGISQTGGADWASVAFSQCRHGDIFTRPARKSKTVEDQRRTTS